MVIVDVPSVLWSAGGALFFGSSTALNDYLYDDVPDRKQAPFIVILAVQLIVAGHVSLFHSLFMMCITSKRRCQCITSPVVNHKGLPFANKKAKKRAIVQAVVSAFCLVSTECFVVQGHKTAQGSDFGLFDVIVVTHLLLTPILAHCRLKEHMTVVQWLTVLGAFTGIVLMCIGDFFGANGNGPSKKFTQVAIYGVAASNTAIFCTLALKFAFEHGIAASSLNYLRMLSIICFSVLLLAIGVALGEEPSFHSDAQVWFITGSGALYGAGLVCLNYALSTECTSLSLAVLWGGSRIVALAVWISVRRKNWEQHPVKLGGIALIALSVTLALLMPCCWSSAQKQTKYKSSDSLETNSWTNASFHS